MKRIEMPKKKKQQIMYDVKKHEIKLFLDDSELVWIWLTFHVMLKHELWYAEKAKKLKR